MPRIQLLAMCQMVVLESETMAPSLISVLNGITVSPQQGHQLDDDTVMSFPWYAISIWRRTPEDEGRKYEQRLRLIRPDGTATGETTYPFEMTAISHTFRLQSQGFPVGQQGDYTLELAIREADSHESWKVAATYLLQITHEQAYKKPSTPDDPPGEDGKSGI